jgi:hypothetical protein
MKAIVSLMIACALMLFVFSPSHAQVAAQRQLNARLVSDGVKVALLCGSTGGSPPWSEGGEAPHQFQPIFL